MNIAFVGIKKDWDDLQRRDYVYSFIRYHLELPYYFARFGGNDVTIVTDDFDDILVTPSDEHGRIDWSLRCQRAEDFVRDIHARYDVVIHWRKWFGDLYRPEAVNVINSQDHSYSQQWLVDVGTACATERLYGILCFPRWHYENLCRELSSLSRIPRLLPGVTLGVDTDIYRPVSPKSRYELLWASDPGRGWSGAAALAIELFKRDRRYKLHFCWPDYYTDRGSWLNHPAFQVHRNLDNGPELWGLFNTCGFLPYTSNFMEPSSRCHRQAQAAGSVVLYPPNMGTPSDLIEDGVTGFVRDPVKWADIIHHMSDKEFQWISEESRKLALQENWEVQAKRFNTLLGGIVHVKH